MPAEMGIPFDEEMLIVCVEYSTCTKYINQYDKAAKHFFFVKLSFTDE